MVDSEGIGAEGSETGGGGGAEAMDGESAGEDEPGDDGVDAVSCRPPGEDPPISLLPELLGCLGGPDPNEPDDPEPSEPDGEEDPFGRAAVWTVGGRFCPCSNDLAPEFA
jgi:hypothetical protein